MRENKILTLPHGGKNKITMGEIAEEMLDGSCCDLCGQYFDHPKGGIYVHDHPATCWDCWEYLRPEEKKHHTKADVETF